ncbi:protein IQ-DOMAIN 1-like [Phoenix dactylifera]|uniref:Protein IQ-DOMAIN 1-like n=1 Tax=Phoenix dactylifera TaxID=42345 RepID=A0A8B9ANM2_PHODC|nr:protein IQ-DOMAIN 1-like [Phoenix dactylifera]XP_038988357.1 protein IQ-DOMAIN 1-like [Phoenix dactylifera]
MGRKGKWYISIKKIFTAESKVKKDKKFKRKRIWRCGKFADSDRFDSGSFDNSARAALPPPPPPPPVEARRPDGEDGQNNHAYSVAVASAVAAEAAVVAAQAAAEVARLTASSRIAGRSREETAAIKIQTAVRGYMARRRLRALRGFVRLKSMVEGNAVKRRTTNTLYRMQTWARVQSQIRSRRIRMIEENLALQRQLQLKREKELERSKLGEEWDDSLQSKEQLEASLLNKQEAAIRRERTLAYAYSHQWKSSSRSVAPTFTDPHNPQWGWSWLERRMAARPWENRGTSEKDLNDHASAKSAGRSIAGDLNSAHGPRNSVLERSPPPPRKPSRSASRQPPSTPPSKASSAAGKLKSVSPKNGWRHIEDDSRSTHSSHSERAPRRQSVPGPSTRDDASLVSTPAVPSYMASTESARAKSRFQSPSALSDSVETSEKRSTSSAMKRLSFAETDKHGVSSPGAARRHSGPPKVNIAPLKDVGVGSEQDMSNGATR